MKKNKKEKQIKKRKTNKKKEKQIKKKKNKIFFI